MTTAPTQTPPIELGNPGAAPSAPANPGANPGAAPTVDPAGATPPANPGQQTPPATPDLPGNPPRQLPSWAMDDNVKAMNLDPSLIREDPLSTLRAVNESLVNAQKHISETRKAPVGGDPLKIGESAGAAPEANAAAGGAEGYQAIRALYSEAPEGSGIDYFLGKAGLDESSMGQAWKEKGELTPEHYQALEQKLGIPRVWADVHYAMLAETAAQYEQTTLDMAKQAAGGEEQLNTLAAFGGTLDEARRADLTKRLNNQATVIGAVRELELEHQKAVGGGGDPLVTGSASGAVGAATPSKTMDEHRNVMRRYQESMARGAPDRALEAIIRATDTSKLT